jgi:predicted N-formylglutamate amidohydrolase
MEEAPYESVEGDSASGILFLCDHASRALPPGYGSLGLPPGEFATHIASDIGAAALTRALAAAFGAPAVLGKWSRLLVDLNRGADDPTVVMRLSDGRIVPGNRDADAAEVGSRIARFHAPYHDAVAARIAASLAAGRVPVLLSMHSFTPNWRGWKRPWHIGVLWHLDGRVARPLMARLAKEPDIVVGDNEPYPGELENDTLYRHGKMTGVPHVLIEVRQDLIAGDAGVVRWAARLVPILKDTLAAMGEPALHFARPLMPKTEMAMDEKTRTELEAAVFRRLVAHLRARTDVQNIDMMNLAGFCRNCLGDWYREAAAEKGIALDKDQAREIVYGMPPAEWKRRYQKDASAEAQAKFAAREKTHS